MLAGFLRAKQWMHNGNHDVIVVGAGFAGLACARELARAGKRVCVLDRKRDLGERLHTTGILVQEALADPLLADLPAAIRHAVPAVKLYAPGLENIELAAPGYRFHTTDTPALMRWLGEQALEAGVELRLSCAFREARAIADGWQLPGIGQCRYLVGADGARSKVAAYFGLGRVREFLYGVEHEYDGAGLHRPDALHCFISRRWAPGYIGWIAQTPRGVQAGLALRMRPGTRPPDLAGFLDHVAPVVGLSRPRPPDSVRAGLIPCGGPVHPRLRHDVLLAGDAAGVVSPVTAGGIHSGLRHGADIGRALVQALESGIAPQVSTIRAIPAWRRKRALRWAFDHLQWDWPFDLLLASPPLRRMAEQIYFHRRGQASAAA